MDQRIDPMRLDAWTDADYANGYWPNARTFVAS
jgi:hypothetical protein